jgi:hypothetical protein
MPRTSRLKARDILIAWLRGQVSHEVPSHRIELELPRYGQLLYNALYNPATYSREWRLLREDQEALTACGLIVQEINELRGAEKAWRIISR